MNKIVCHGELNIPISIIENAETIKFENYKTNVPSKFQIRQLNHYDIELMDELSKIIYIDKEYMDFVYFSVCKGAEPHTDLLDPNVFLSKTFVIPVILPKCKSVITVEDEKIEVKLNHIYEFNHEKIHSMELEDMESGCVVIMVAVKK